MSDCWFLLNQLVLCFFLISLKIMLSFISIKKLFIQLNLLIFRNSCNCVQQKIVLLPNPGKDKKEPLIRVGNIAINSIVGRRPNDFLLSLNNLFYQIKFLNTFFLNSAMFDLIFAVMKTFPKHIRFK